MIELTPATLIGRSPDFIDADDGDEVLMLDPDGGAYIRLNPVGGEIWRLTLQPVSVGAIRAALLEMFEVAPDVCDAEMRSFLQAMLARGAMIVVDADR